MKTDNELIAEFMGLLCDWDKLFFQPLDRTHYYSEEMKYATSWDWLMPVVEKIEKIDTDDLKFQIEYNCCKVEFYGFGKRLFTGKTKIESTYKAVVDFIKWHNTHTERH